MCYNEVVKGFEKIIKLSKKKKLRKVVAVKKIPVKKLKKQLEKVCHDFIRGRDGINGQFKGYCFDCGNYAEGQQFQAGHWEASGSSGALLRYHPHNIHGQTGGCNMAYSQERVKIAYTLRMIDKYGREYVDKLRAMKHKTIKADSTFYTTMIRLYEYQDENMIVQFLESL